MAKKARDRRSSSRHSTPLSNLDDTAPPTPIAVTPPSAAPVAAATPVPVTPNIPKETAYLRTATSAIVSFDPLIESDIEALSNGRIHDPPTARALHDLHDKIRDTVNKFMEKRGEVCDRSMRLLAQKRKERLQMERELEIARAEEAARTKREREREREKEREDGEAAEVKRKKVGKKRSHEEMDVDGPEDDQERKEKKEVLPSVGAHGVARQDGIGVHEGQPAPPSPIIVPGTVVAEPMDVAPSPTDSDISRSELPATAPLYERVFGKDPLQSYDPTVYDIRDLYPDMPYEDKRAILNVLHWPESDLHDLTAGDPPDMDLSNAKPANQINFSTFQTYVEPHIRPFTEEDVAYLKERSDRVTPYVIPQRGARGYKEVWASEDGLDGVAPPRKQEADPNEARGSMDDMNDDTAETDEISMGPIMNRLLSIVRPAPSGIKKETPAEDADGDTTMTNGVIAAANTLEPSTTLDGTAEEDRKPITYLAPDAPRPTTLPASDYDSLDQRALQELRHIGFLTPTDTPDFASFSDDEVAARLRTLQHELRRVARLNNIRKARVLELCEERMAMQEYSNIADDLDNQVNAAYLKRNRSLGKSHHKKGGGGGGGATAAGGGAARPGGQQKGVGAAGGGGGGGRGVSDGVRALMQKRRDWIDMVGPVVSYGRPPIPGEGETIFDEASLKRLEKVEREAELGEVEAE